MKTLMKFVLFCFMIGLFVLANTLLIHSQREVNEEVVNLLQNSDYDTAYDMAMTILDNDSNNSRANVVAAFVLYKNTLHQLVRDFITVILSADELGDFNHRYMRWTLGDAETRLTKVDNFLAAAAKDRNFSMDLCLAELEIDWNANGTIDESDMWILQIEYDENGTWINENDPARTPTFRFDYGDIFWARAMINFQKAIINILLAYSYEEFTIDALDRAFTDGETLTLHLRDAKLIKKAKNQILDGLTFADRAREEYLNERDDYKEWLPNPDQDDHPMPLPVDVSLYETWKEVISDIRNLLKGTEGINVAEVAQLGDLQWENPPAGFINIARLFDSPGDIVINFDNIFNFAFHRNTENAESILRDIFGDKYVDEMPNSKLISRLQRMKSEIERGTESFERKLRYLFWLN